MINIFKSENDIIQSRLIPDINIEYSFHPFIINKDNDHEYISRGIKFSGKNRFGWNSSYCIVNAKQEHQTLKWLLWRISRGRLITYFRGGNPNSKRRVKDRDIKGIVYEPYRKTKKTFDKTRLLFLDIDNDDNTKEYTSLDHFLENDDQFLFIYTSPSHTDKINKFRVVYLIDEYITDSEILKKSLQVISNGLNCDKSCFTADRGFYGNTNGIFYVRSVPNLLRFKDIKHNIQFENITESKVSLNSKNAKIVLDNCIICKYLYDKNKCNHEDVLVVISNLSRITKMKDIVKSLIKNRWSNSSKFDSLWESYKTTYKGSIRCNDCRYSEGCLLFRYNTQNRLFTMMTSKKRIFDPKTVCHISNERLLKDKSNIHDVREQMYSIFQDTITNKSSGKMYIFKGETGIGKTKMLEYFSYPGLYCIRNHRLIDELKIGQAYPIISDDFPEFNLISKCYKCGIPTSVVLKNIIKKNYKNPIVKKYLDELKEFNTNKIKKVTHLRFLMSDILTNIDLDTIIIDEDILSSSIRAGTILISGFKQFLNNLPDKLSSMIQKELSKYGSINVYNRTPFSNITKKMIIEYIGQNIKNINNFIKEYVNFIMSDMYYIDSSSMRINFINTMFDKIRLMLEMKKKIILLSATPIVGFYENIFEKDLIETVKLPKVKIKGNIVVFKPISRVTKSYLDSKKLLTLLDKVNIYKTNNVISYKIFKNVLYDNGYNMIDHFFNTEGTNLYSGKDMIIIGTPRYPETYYAMIAKLMGINNLESYTTSGFAEGEDYTIKQRCFKDPDAASLQIRLIQSELIQAIGRSRLVNNSSNVVICSDVPVPDYICNII